MPRCPRLDDAVLGVRPERGAGLVERCDAVVDAEAVDVGAEGKNDAGDVVTLVEGGVGEQGGPFPVFGLEAAKETRRRSCVGVGAGIGVLTISTRGPEWTRAERIVVDGVELMVRRGWGLLCVLM
jgi:hypothetical protein